MDGKFAKKKKEGGNFEQKQKLGGSLVS